MTKSTCIIALNAGLVITLLGIAFAAGRMDERVDTVETDVEVVKDDIRNINQHLHKIDLSLGEQTTILKRMERKDQ